MSIVYNILLSAIGCVISKLVDRCNFGFEKWWKLLFGKWYQKIQVPYILTHVECLVQKKFRNFQRFRPQTSVIIYFTFFCQKHARIMGYERFIKWQHNWEKGTIIPLEDITTKHPLNTLIVRTCFRRESFKANEMRQHVCSMIERKMQLPSMNQSPQMVNDTYSILLLASWNLIL